MTKVILFFVLLLTAFPADAAPLAVLIPIVAGAITKSLILKFAISMALTLALSALQKAMQKKPRSPGITVEQTLTGGVVSRSFVVGLYCTAGSQACPPMSHGRDGKTPNAYLTHVINISDIPVDGLTGLIVNGEEVAIGATETSVYGRPILGKYSGYGWIKFYDGTQTTADSMLVSTYGSYPNRPWTANHIGTGVAYAILTWRYNVDIFKGEPTFKFIVRGIKLYDPRKDSSVGGSGAHRWGQPNTYEFSDNNVVIMYNINRGISFADGSKWGGECEHDDLPLTNWVSGMNSCDELITGSNGPEKRFRAGYEIQVASDEPAEIQEEFLKGCSGSIAEIGGIYKIRIGGPSLPVLFISDDDIIVSNDSEYNPYPQMTDGYNSIFSTYPNPAEQWNTHDAPIVSDAAYLAQDDSIENQANVPLPTVPYPLQVQRLMQAWLKDDRRWRKHSFSLGPYAFLLEPLDSVAWSSVHNGYSNKVFEIQTATINFRSIDTVAALREADPTDFTWTADQELPDPATPGGWLLPDAQSVPGWAVEAYAIVDGAGVPRRPAIRASWTADGAEDATSLKIQVREAVTSNQIADITISRVTDGQVIISGGIVSGQSYECRARYDAERSTIWTDWLSVTVGNILLDPSEITGLEQLVIDTQNALEVIEDVNEDISDLKERATQTEQDIINAQGEIVTLGETVSLQGGYISDHTTLISNMNGTLVNHTNSIGTLTTDVGIAMTTANGVATDLGLMNIRVNTLRSDVDLNITAITELENSLSEFEIRVSAGNPNLMPGGMEDVSRWSIASGPPGQLVSSFGNSWGTYIYHSNTVMGNSPGFDGWVIIDSIDEIAVDAGVSYTVTGEIDSWTYDAAYPAQVRFEIMWLDAGGAVISHSFGPTINNASFWWDVATMRQALKLTDVPPAGVVRMKLRIVSYCARMGGFAVRRVKLERGAVATAFTNEANARQTYTAISGINSQMSDISTQVSVERVRIDNQVTALNYTNNNVTTLFARASLRLDVDGRWVGWEINNNGTTGAIDLHADYVTITKPGAVEKLEMTNNCLKVFDENAVPRVKIGNLAA